MPSLGGLPEAPCVRCGKHARIAWGELCPLCQNARIDQAIRVSRWVALGAAFLTGLWASLRVPANQRWYAAVAVAAVYVIVRRIATRMAMELLPRDWEKAGSGKREAGSGERGGA